MKVTMKGTIKMTKEYFEPIAEVIILEEEIIVTDMTPSTEPFPD